MLNSSPVLKLLDGIFLIKLIEETFEQKNQNQNQNQKFKKNVIPSGVLSFRLYCFHSVYISVIPSELLQF